MDRLRILENVHVVFAERELVTILSSRGQMAVCNPEICLEKKKRVECNNSIHKKGSDILGKLESNVEFHSKDGLESLEYKEGLKDLEGKEGLRVSLTSVKCCQLPWASRAGFLPILAGKASLIYSLLKNREDRLFQ